MRWRRLSGKKGGGFRHAVRGAKNRGAYSGDRSAGSFLCVVCHVILISWVRWLDIMKGNIELNNRNPPYNPNNTNQNQFGITFRGVGNR